MGLDCRQALALFSGWTCMLVCGALYVYGGIAPYLVSDLYYKGTNVVIKRKQRYFKFKTFNSLDSLNGNN